MVKRTFGVGYVRQLGLVATAVLAVSVAPAAAQGNTQGREVPVKKLGGTTRFSQPMHSVDDLRSMAGANRQQLTRVLTLAGLGDISTQVMDTLTTGEITETTITPGTHMQWMALKRSGTPGILRNVRWAGRSSFDAYQVVVTGGGFNYTFMLPKVCGNISLLTTTPVPAVVSEAPRVTPPPPEEPAPVVQAPPPAPPVAAVPTPTHERYQWVASGFVGDNFNTNLDRVDNEDVDSNITFGGQVAYMWRDWVGGEFIADFGH